MRLMQRQLCLLFILLSVLSASVWAQSTLGPSDQKAGSLLVFPYLTFNSTKTANTRITISNISSRRSVTYHLFFVDSSDCTEQDINPLFLTPNASISFLMSDYFLLPAGKTSLTGYLIITAIDPTTKCPIQNNSLIGDAFVKLPAGYLTASAGTVNDTYSAQAFWAYQNPACNPNNTSAILNFDGVTYDKMPNAFITQLQRPSIAPGQTIVTAGMSGSLLPPGVITGAGLNGIATFKDAGKAAPGQFAGGSTSSIQAGSCFAMTTIIGASSFGFQLETAFTSGYGTLRLPITAGLGLIITAKDVNGYSAIVPMHFTSLTNATLEVPVL